MDHVIVLILDGLRPDLVSAATMPFVNKLQQQSVLFPNACSVFPSATRVCSGSLTTGTYPTAHGLAENSLLMRNELGWEVGACADQAFLVRMAQAEKRRLLLRKTLPELLRESGRTSFCGGSGSTGTTFLMDPTEAGNVLHWSTAWPRAFKAQIEQGTGFLSQETTTDEQNAFILAHAMDVIRSPESPDLVWVWLTEPDTAQHDFGLGSDEALAVMAVLDRRVETFFEQAQAALAGRNVTFIVLSDHGAVTPQNDALTLAERFCKLPVASQLGHGAFVCYENSIAIADPANIAVIVHALDDEPWVSGILVRDDYWDESMPALKQSDVYCGGHRSAEIMVAFASSDEMNVHGISGMTEIGSNRAQHGSGSLYELNPLMFAWSADIEPRIETCAIGLVDVHPTICDLLGVDCADGGLRGSSFASYLDALAQHESLSERTAQQRGPFQVEYAERKGNRYVRRVVRT